MVSTPESEIIQTRLQAVNDALNTGVSARVRQLLLQLSASDIADLLESSPPKARSLLWNLIKEEDKGEILEDLSDEIRNQFALEMEPEQLAHALSGLDTDDLADILGDLPDQLSNKVLHSMDDQDQQRVKLALAYPEDSAGGLMNTDTVTVRQDVTVDVVLRYLRMRGELPENTDNLYVVNRDDEYIGVVALQDLVISPPEQEITEVMSDNSDSISVDIGDAEVAQIFERYDLLSAPVVNAKGQLLGRITIDDVVDVIIEDAEHSLMSMGRLNEDEDAFAPVVVSAKRRALWLGVNLITAVVAASVSNYFEGILDKLATVAILMTIVPSMGGIAGTQTLTLMVRAIALGQIGESNSRWLLYKELAVGIINGMVWALVIAGIVGYWKDDVQLGIIIASAMAVNMTVAGLAGVSIPLMLKKMNIDPALAGGVILTTITDVVGLVAFLGLATVILG
ncbi:MAG: magnesium transporter [Gammaproteobacteria bacterium]|nr:MAG: magnesium transporter [Gammaproteobacteria bacterium]